MRQVLDAVRDTALESLRLSDDYRKNGGVCPVIDTPHYIFSPGGSLFAAYRDAARAEPSHVRLLWDEYMEIVLQVSSTYQTKRIANAVEELASIDPFSENASSLLGDISDELLQIEFENPKRVIRRKGKSKYAGRFVGKVEWRIYVDPHSKKVSVGKEEYAFTAYLDWVAMDMVLAAISRDDHGAVIKITTAEWNALHDGCKKFFEKYVQREKLPRGLRNSNNHRMTDRARFMYEKLKTGR